MNRDSTIQFIDDVISQEFPNARIVGWVQGNGQTLSGDLNNLFFLGTKFYAQSTDKKYLHFTTSMNAVKILKSNCLWLSNLNAFDDKLEFTLAVSKLLGISDELQNKTKDALFAACFTELGPRQNVFEDFPYHWTRYSGDGGGVCLEFEFGPPTKRGTFEDPVLPSDYYLIKVQYHDDPRADTLFGRLTSKIDEVGDTTNLRRDSLAEFLFPFVCAYKREKAANEVYSSEKEIRLFHSCSKDPRDYDFYQTDNKGEGTFAGIDNTYRPFHQLPFNTANAFLRLAAIYMSERLTKTDKSAISDLASKLELRVNSKE